MWPIENLKFNAKYDWKLPNSTLSKYCLTRYDRLTLMEKGGRRLNQVALVGRITKDPILREIARDRVQTNFVLAVNRNFKNTRGEIEADFILCSLWGKLAENTAKHCGKGSLISVSGRIQSRSYEREDKSRVYVTEVIGYKVQFIATKSRATAELYAEPTVFETVQAAQSTEEEHFQLPKRESNDLPIM